MYPVTMFYCIYYVFVILVINVTMFFIVTTLLYIHAYLPIPGQCIDFVISVLCDCVFYGAIFYCTSVLTTRGPWSVGGCGGSLTPGAVPLPLQGIVHCLGGLLLFG